MATEHTGPTGILADVLDYIEDHHGNLKRLADEAGVSYDWLCSIRQGRRKDPRLSGVQKILDHKRRTYPIPLIGEG